MDTSEGEEEGGKGRRRKGCFLWLTTFQCKQSAVF